jgi:hypothetical protein
MKKGKTLIKRGLGGGGKHNGIIRFQGFKFISKEVYKI